MINEPWEETDNQQEDMDEELVAPESDVIQSPSLSEVPSYEEERSYWQDN